MSEIDRITYRGARISATTNPDNVVPFRRPENPLAFAPGVPPFNPADPKHVALWNAAVKYGQIVHAGERR